MNYMKRRRFIRTASTTLLLPLYPAIAFAAYQESSRFYYDQRFEAGRRLAGEWAGTVELIPVQSDVTEVWRAGLSNICRSRPLVLRGATTESFHFCLATALSEFARLDSTISRVDRDLYSWTIRSVPVTNKGKQS